MVRKVCEDFLGTQKFPAVAKYRMLSQKKSSLWKHLCNINLICSREKTTSRPWFSGWTTCWSTCVPAAAATSTWPGGNTTADFAEPSPAKLAHNSCPSKTLSNCWTESKWMVLASRQACLTSESAFLVQRDLSTKGRKWPAKVPDQSSVSITTNCRCVNILFLP